jgi:hypothetical protein
MNQKRIFISLFLLSFVFLSQKAEAITNYVWHNPLRLLSKLKTNTLIPMLMSQCGLNYRGQTLKNVFMVFGTAAKPSGSGSRPQNPGHGADRADRISPMTKD